MIMVIDHDHYHQWQCGAATFQVGSARAVLTAANQATTSSEVPGLLVG